MRSPLAPASTAPRDGAAAPDTAAQPRLRVAVALPSHHSRLIGGAEQQVAYLLEAMAAAPDLEVRYFTGNVAEDFASDSYGVERLGRGGPPGRRARLVQSWRLTAALRRFSPHVIYQRVGCAYTGAAARHARASGARLVWHIASDGDLAPRPERAGLSLAGLEKRLLEYGIRHADAVVAQTRAQARALEARYARSDAAIIRNFHPQPARAAQRSARPKVLWIANYKPLKRPELFMELAKRLAHLDAEFVMAGRLPDDPGQREALRRGTTAAANLRHVGLLSQEEVNALLEDSHLLVNTSEYEGFSNTFIQAWLRGVPVVTVGVDPDGLISEQGRGVVAADADGLAATVRELLQDASRTAAMGEHARRVASREFSMGNAAALIELLREQGSRAAAAPQAGRWARK